MRILVVEDDRDVQELVRQILESAGFVADLVDNGVDGEFMGREEDYDAIILDLGLPGKPGIEVLQSWRKDDIKTPVIILTGRDAWYEKVEGFKAGADDYLAKPFHVQELLARLQALLRRQAGRADNRLRESGLELDEDRQVVMAHGEEYALTAMEFRLLRYFMRNPGKVLSKTRLSEHIYEYDGDKDSNVIEVYINRLRQKLGKSVIQTRRGQGYIFGGGG